MNSAFNIDAETAIELHRLMVLIRRFEEESSRLYMQGKIRGFLHLYIGQEAVAAGAIPCLRPDDYVVSHYRDHGHALAKGMDPSTVMAELCGKATGSSGGKGGSMHLFNVSKGFMGGYAIVGGQLPIAAGLAHAIKYREEDRVVLCFFGDGAVNEGEFHETINLAAVWKLPILFFLENNLYGMGTHVEKTHALGKDIYLSADAYGVPAAQIDGMDLIAVRDTTMMALDRIRSGSGPVFVEAMTYRFRGHSVADPSNYRDSEEVSSWQVRDPIARFQELALENEAMSSEDLRKIGEDVESTVAEAVRFADESEIPDPANIMDNVYA